jgi:hypothetical protein
MHGFRAYIIGDDGHVKDRVDLMCADEGEAKHRAKQLVNGQPIELWHLDRKIARFDPPKASTDEDGH